ncbi:hypothetical protein B0T14DRAFT_482257 [Immersiella caudata]|uniref:Uncharacterized protein n=1 Tax=Immersiella caudata TaxID=314043 RepID=A0AA39WIR4_9PEZI|nr:hypothetical protein B0T14DRAFT_482257 [Immersiella caudata]
MSVFVNYDGPNLGKKERRAVRSQAMVAVRCQQRQAKAIPDESTNATSKPGPRQLLPARDPCPSANGGSENDSDELEPKPTTCSGHARVEGARTRPVRASAVPNTGQKRAQLVVPKGRHALIFQQTNPWDMRGAPPQSTHMTGVSARIFHDYLSRCGSYSSYLEEAFILVPGFRQPSYFRPDLSKAACIYIGWLLTAGVLDASTGKDVAYPWYEYQAVKELKAFVEGGGRMELYEVIYPVVILSIFEMVRFNPRAITHFAAVENIIRTRGGVGGLPDVMQHLVITADLIECISLNTPLAFNDLGQGPIMHLTTSEDFPAGDQLRSCPLLLCDSEDFSLAAQFVDPDIQTNLVLVLTTANDAFRFLFSISFDLGKVGPLSFERKLDATAILDATATPIKVSGLFLQACGLATRIACRTISGEAETLDDAIHQVDVRVIYDNLKFIGLKAWAGLPYIYVWVNLIGFAAARDEKMRMYFIAEIVRCLYSYGCYQMPVFKTVLVNFLHLRNAINARKMMLEKLFDC